MNWLKIKNLSLSNFGPFVGSHRIDLPENGLVLIKGEVQETGDGSGAGKSFLLNSIPFIFGGCPFSGTELQSWYTKDPPEVSCSLQCGDGLLSFTRKNGLTIKGIGEPVKGNAANAELDRIFGMDVKTRAQVTYRAQRTTGRFLSMSDPDKKGFLAKLLPLLDKFETVSIAANRAMDDYEIQISSVRMALSAGRNTFDRINAELAEAVAHINQDEKTSYQGQVTHLEQKCCDLEKEIGDITGTIDSAVRQNSAELDAVLIATVKKKVTDVNSLSKPIEITALEKELEEWRQKQLKCRDYNNKQKLEVEAKKSALKQEGVALKGAYQQKVSALKAEYLSKINEISSMVAVLSKSRSQLEDLKRDESRLRSSLCPKCERPWDKAVEDLNANLLQQSVLQGNVDRIDELEKEISSLKKEEANKRQALIEEGSSILKQKEQELLSVQDPPLHSATPKIEAKLLELSGAIKKAELEFYNSKKQKLKELDEEEKGIRKTFADKLSADLSAKRTKVAQLSSVRDENSQTIRSFKDQLLVISQKEAKVEILKKNLADEEAYLRDMEKSLKDLERLANLEYDIVALTGRTGFLGAIFGDVLNEISSQTNEILGQVANVRHLSLDFETEKEAASTGNITSRITPVIYNRGRKVTFDAGISGGMQAAVELAVDLAVGNVVSTRRGYYPNFLILDESLHGLGGVAKESCIEMLGSVAGDRLVLVVDHSSEFCNLFNQVIKVVQVDGQSRIDE